MSCVPKEFCAGNLNTVITVEEPTDADDGAGGTTRTWSTVLDGVRAYKKHVGGGEFWKHSRLETNVTDVFWTYYFASAAEPMLPLITSHMRLKDMRGNYYNIKKAEDPTDTFQYLEIQAEKGVLD